MNAQVRPVFILKRLPVFCANIFRFPRLVSHLVVAVAGDNYTSVEVAKADKKLQFVS
jgi:hypothetical protein